MSPYMKAYESGIKLAHYHWRSKIAKDGAGKSDPIGFDQQLDNFRSTLEEQGIPKSRISDLVSYAYEHGRQTGNYNPSLEGLEQRFPQARQQATPKSDPVGFDQQLDNFRSTLEEQGIPKSRISDLVSYAYEHGRQTGNYNPSLEGLEQRFPQAGQQTTLKDMPKQISTIQTKTPLQALNLPRQSPQIGSKLTLGTNPIEVGGGGPNKLRSSEVSSPRADLKMRKDVNAKPSKMNYLNQGNKG